MGKQKGANHKALVWLLLVWTITVTPTAEAQNNAKQLFFDGFELLKDGKPKEAALRFEEGLKEEPNNAMALHFLGESYLALGDKPRARERFQASLAADPSSQVAADSKKRLAELSDNVFADGGTAGDNLPKPGTEIQDCATCPVVVVVPAGKFIMGSPPDEVGHRDAEAAHMVTIAKPFAVGKFEVTLDEWDACVRERGCVALDDFYRERCSKGNCPADNLDWQQAVGYAEWLSEKTHKTYRLLSEAEWEYSARSGSEKARFWGSSADRACDFANVRDRTFQDHAQSHFEFFKCNDGYVHTAPVGSFKSNNFGLYDMLGNVQEWVEDCFSDGNNYRGAPVDGSAWLSGECRMRVFRGGSAYSEPEMLRSASRIRTGLTSRSQSRGFRIARTLP